MHAPRAKKWRTHKPLPPCVTVHNQVPTIHPTHLHGPHTHTPNTNHPHGGRIATQASSAILNDLWPGST